MKTVMKFLPFFLALPTLLFHYSCGEKAVANTNEDPTDSSVNSIEEKSPAKAVSEEFKSYWYAADAEITSYTLEQGRYGELREGHAVLIYVTEPFLGDVQVKADRSGPDNISVLKLNSTKKYLTGIYPYSIMSSTFYPVADNQHAIKVSSSVQEWCGHVYSQLNNRSEFEFMSHSYFEGEADQQLSLSKSWLENEIWNKIRISPKDLPLGDFEMIPSLEFLRTGHKEIKAYKVTGKVSESDGITVYSISYPELSRSLSIRYRSDFPYTIEGWEETFTSGYGPKAKILTSKGTKLKVLKTPYWRQNGVEDEVLRDELGL